MCGRSRDPASGFRAAAVGQVRERQVALHSSAFVRVIGLLRNNLRALPFAIAFGVAAFFTAFGWAALNPTRLDWIFIGGLDPSMQFLGWHTFRYEKWSWPPGATPSYGYPIGTSIALTDAIPIFGLLFKALSPVLPRKRRAGGRTSLPTARSEHDRCSSPKRSACKKGGA